MQRGFKKEAKQLALEIRAELSLDAFGRFDPYALAAEYGIPLYQLSELGQDELAGQAGSHYALSRPSTFSATLVPVGNARLILEHDHHATVCRRNSVSHEMSHVILEHTFTDVLLACDGCRSVDRSTEEEADLWVPKTYATRRYS
jgi:hypothetical protein